MGIEALYRISLQHQNLLGFLMILEGHCVEGLFPSPWYYCKKLEHLGPGPEESFGRASLLLADFCIL